jgi:hypothetical protein
MKNQEIPLPNDKAQAAKRRKLSSLTTKAENAAWKYASVVNKNAKYFGKNGSLRERHIDAEDATETNLKEAFANLREAILE